MDSSGRQEQTQGEDHSAARASEFPHLLVHHPDDETLTVEDALNTLRSQSHQRAAALLEWLAEQNVTLEQGLVAAAAESADQRTENERLWEMLPPAEHYQPPTPHQELVMRQRQGVLTLARNAVAHYPFSNTGSRIESYMTNLRSELAILDAMERGT